MVPQAGRPCTGRAPSSFVTGQKGEGPGEAEGKSRASVAGAQGDSCLTHCHHSRVLRVTEAVVSTTATSSRGISVSNLPSLCLFPHLKYGTVTPTSGGYRENSLKPCTWGAGAGLSRLSV